MFYFNLSLQQQTSDLILRDFLMTKVSLHANFLGSLRDIWCLMRRLTKGCCLMHHPLLVLGDSLTSHKLYRLSEQIVSLHFSRLSLTLVNLHFLIGHFILMENYFFQNLNLNIMWLIDNLVHWKAESSGNGTQDVIFGHTSHLNLFTQAQLRSLLRHSSIARARLQTFQNENLALR